MIDAIFVPRGSEERAVRRGLARAQATCAVIATGIGSRAATRAVAEARRRPDGALVTGFCGLLSPAFRVGETLVYASVRRRDGASIAFDRNFAVRIGDRVSDAQSGIRALASETVVTRAADKRDLGQRYGVDAIDMESFALAAALQQHNVPVAVLRVASDGVADDLPELDRALDGSGGIDAAALALAMVRRPVAGAKLAANGIRALRALEHAVYAIVRAEQNPVLEARA